MEVNSAVSLAVQHEPLSMSHRRARILLCSETLSYAFQHQILCPLAADACSCRNEPHGFAITAVRAKKTGVQAVAENFKTIGAPARVAFKRDDLPSWLRSGR